MRKENYLTVLPVYLDYNSKRNSIHNAGESVGLVVLYEEAVSQTTIQEERLVGDEDGAISSSKFLI